MAVEVDMVRNHLSFLLLAGPLLTTNGWGASIVKGNWDIVNKTGQQANDFHIDAYSDSNLKFVKSVNGAFGTFNHGQSIFNPLVKQYDWSNGIVPNGGITHIGLELSQDAANAINIQQAFWTLNGVKIGGFVKLAGFEVVPPAGNLNVRVRLMNETPPGEPNIPIFIRNASWRVNNAPTPLEDLLYNGIGPTTPTPTPNFRIDSFFDVFPNLPLQNGDYFLLQGQVYGDEAGTDLIGNFVYEHEHIPEPASLLLVGAGLLALGLARSRMHLGERSI